MKRRKNGQFARSNIIGIIYVIHFDSPLSFNRKGKKVEVKHYIGWTEGELSSRLDKHLSGQGAKILAALKQRSIGWKVTSTFVGTRNDERTIKRQKNNKRFCSDCSSKKFNT